MLFLLITFSIWQLQYLICGHDHRFLFYMELLLLLQFHVTGYARDAEMGIAKMPIEKSCIHNAPPCAIFNNTFKRSRQTIFF